MCIYLIFLYPVLFSFTFDMTQLTSSINLSRHTLSGTVSSVGVFCSEFFFVFKIDWISCLPFDWKFRWSNAIVETSSVLFHRSYVFVEIPLEILLAQFLLLNYFQNISTEYLRIKIGPHAFEEDFLRSLYRFRMNCPCCYWICYPFCNSVFYSFLFETKKKHQM